MRTWTLLILMSLMGGCAANTGGPALDDADNPFLETDSSKDDSGYLNLRGVEAEVTIEADLEAPEYRFFDGPADLAQYAVTYLRSGRGIYMEILAEDADAPNRVEWQVDGEWVSREQARAAGIENLRRFRLRGVNVVFMDGADSLASGDVIEAKVPVRPYATMQEGGPACTDPDAHLGLDQGIYWYLWNPDHSGCTVDTQQMTLTVDRVLPRNPESYPEYDELLADGRIEAAVVFGKLDEGNVEDDYNWRNVDALAHFLESAGFARAEEAPEGARRYEKQAGDFVESVDIYGPDFFHSVADYSRLANWQRAVNEHEIVMYNGHSVLGSGMAFEQVEYPEKYQIFQVASCLSYEYYVRPILAGKGSWDSVDVVSNVEPTYYTENIPLTSTILAQIFKGAENGGNKSWQDIMNAVSNRLGHARFGVSGARDNCFTPTGDRCGAPPPPPAGDDARFESTGAVDIPDDDPAGATSIIDAESDATIGSLSVELDITHTYVGDLHIELTHGGTTAVLWDRQGGGEDDIHQSFDLSDFDGQAAGGEWKLQVVDGAGRDVGTIDSWAIVITPAG